MKKIFALLVLLSASSAMADSFELNKDGNKYVCTQVSGTPIPSTSLSQLCRMAQHGHGETIYYPNGKVFTNYAGQKGATWYYDNGRVMTNYAGQSGATWYFSNGRVLTNYAGQVGATWYYDNGQVMTNYAGQAGATWYYENGSVMTNSGPAMTAEELLYPCDAIR